MAKALEMSEYVLLVLACGAGTYVWRGLGIAVSSRLSTGSELFAWVGCVAFAMLAGLVSRIVLIPSGALEHTALWQRLAATAVSVAVYFVVTRKNLLAGVVSSAVTLYVLLLATGRFS
jgi:branched-subunit amino acid transport protein